LKEQINITGCVINMANDPYDDVFKNLAKVMEELLSNLSPEEPARFIGCTIISGPGNEPKFIQMDETDCNEINYEVVQDSEWVFITAELPPGIESEAHAEIMSESVRIFAGGRETEIPLECRVVTEESSYSVLNGLIDIICKKEIR